MKSDVSIIRNRNELCEYLKQRHKEIACHLQDEILDYIQSDDCVGMDEEYRKVLMDFFNVICQFFNEKQETIAKKLKRSVDRSIVSRRTVDLNFLLMSFCAKRKIYPPVQLFIKHCNPVNPQDRYRFKGFLACSEPVEGHGNCAKNAITLEEAKKQGKLKNQEGFFDPRLEQLKKEFKSKLKDEAIEHLNERLHDKGMEGYIPLEIDIGLLKINKKKSKHRRSRSRRYDHNRKWQHYDYEKLKNLKDCYILSSETGSGKTTFLRMLQLRLIEKSDKIPLFIDAFNLEDIDFKKRKKGNFLKSIAGLFDGYLDNGNELEFLKLYFDKVVFLIDGLDQIRGTGTNYKHLVDNLLEIIKTRLLIASRPFAVIEKERESRVSFLRLKCFDEDNKKKYFGANYEKALRICDECLEMISIPMLAYMVRLSITTGMNEHIDTIGELYGQFVKHIFEKHIRLELSFDAEDEILGALEDISLDAITNTPSHLQKIPYRFAKKSLIARDTKNNINVETLLKVGLPSTIINAYGSEGIFLYFSHQSFQEYLAAKCLMQNDEKKDRFAEILIKRLENYNDRQFWKFAREQEDVYLRVIKFFDAKTGENFCFDIYQKWKKSSVSASAHIAEMMMRGDFGSIAKFENEFLDDYVKYIS